MCCGQDDDRFWQRVFVELMQCDSGVRGARPSQIGVVRQTYIRRT